MAAHSYSHMPLADRLHTSGMPEIVADTWSIFIQEAMSLVYQAVEELRSPEGWAEFCKKRGALSTPKRKSRKVGVVQNPIEDAITTEIGHIVRRLRLQLPPVHILRSHEAVFETEHMIEDGMRSGRHSKKADFLFYSQIGQKAPEIAIEAKPLVSKVDIVNRYLADEGIGCFFSTDSPYTVAPVAAMMAYTIDAAGLLYKADIDTALTQYTPIPLEIGDVGLGPSIPAVTLSRHARVALSLGPISVLHFEVSFIPVEVTAPRA